MLFSIILLFIFLLTSFKGRCVVTGETENFLLNINITGCLFFLLIDLLNTYSVIPGNLLSKKCFFEIGPLIIILLNPLFIKLIPILKQSLI